MVCLVLTDSLLGVNGPSVSGAGTGFFELREGLPLFFVILLFLLILLNFGGEVRVNICRKQEKLEIILY